MINTGWRWWFHRLFKLKDMSVFKLVDKDFLVNTDGRVYFVITPTTKFHPQNFFLEELMENKYLLNELDRDSFQFVFRIVGYVRGLRDIPLFELVEIMQFELLVKIKNISTKEIEIWDEAKFYHCYNLLGKLDALRILQFFIKMNRASKLSKVL